MASNVFGNPITDLTLEAISPEYIGKKIRRTDRAHVALQMRNAEGKDVAAQTYVENLKRQFGDGISTKCLVYNATGDVVKFATHFDWHGKIGQHPYPLEIENGQWGGFLHVKPTLLPAGSAGAVVYSGRNEAGNEYDWMLSWSNPYILGIDNKAYTEINEAGHDIDWENIFDHLKDIHHKSSWKGCSSEVLIGQGTTVNFEAIMTLENA